MNKIWNIGTVGCGVVGTGLISLLSDKREFLKEKYGFEFRLVFVMSKSRGSIVCDDGLDCAAAAKALAGGKPLDALGKNGGADLDKLLNEHKADIVCDMTPTNYVTGEPSLGVLRSALSHGAHAVTCSKGGVSVDMAGLMKLASEHGVQLRFESSVMAGTPMINLVRESLAGCGIRSVRGIVNGTTNYILTQMESGMDYASALAEAQRLGYAEPDPTGDVEGFDAAVKTVIMAGAFFGKSISINDVDRTGITKITPAQVESAKAAGKRIKLIASVECDGGTVRASVKPAEIDTTHPLAGVSGATNAACIRTDNLGEVTIIGPGAGPRETAQGILADILAIARSADC